MVPKAGLEPARVAPLPPQDSVSTKFHHFGKLSWRHFFESPLEPGFELDGAGAFLGVAV